MQYINFKNYWIIYFILCFIIIGIFFFTLDHWSFKINSKRSILIRLILLDVMTSKNRTGYQHTRGIIVVDHFLVLCLWSLVFTIGLSECIVSLEVFVMAITVETEVLNIKASWWVYWLNLSLLFPIMLHIFHLDHAYATIFAS